MFTRNRRNLGVALFGHYDFGNFGDDLMAVIFGLFLRRKKTEFSVYKLCKPYAEKYDFEVSKSISELLRDKDLIVYGGGGVLVSGEVSESLWSKLGDDLWLLLENSHRKRIPIYGVSVGGNGIHNRKLTPKSRQALLESAEYLTVRNPQDLRLLKLANTKGAFFPDVLWLTPAFFPAERRKNRRIRVGLNLYLTNLITQKALYVLLIIYLVTRLRRDSDFVFVDTFNEYTGNFRALGKLGRTSNTFNYAFSDLSKDIEILTSLDVMISTRLHVGLVCMSYGIPFISLFGEKKTALLMKNMGLTHMSYTHTRIPNFISLMVSKNRLRRLISSYRIPNQGDLMKASLGHLRELDAIIDRHRKGKREHYGHRPLLC